MTNPKQRFIQGDKKPINIKSETINVPVEDPIRQPREEEAIPEQAVADYGECPPARVNKIKVI